MIYLQNKKLSFLFSDIIVILLTAVIFIPQFKLFFSTIYLVLGLSALWVLISYFFFSKNNYMDSLNKIH